MAKSYLALLINEGVGSSAVFPQAALQTLTADVLPIGSQMRDTHLLESAAVREAPRQGLSVRDIAGVTAGAPYWDPNGPLGAGQYAQTTVFSDYENFVEEKGVFTGLSIFIAAEYEEQTQLHNGRPMRVLKRFVSHPANGVDLVSRAGRGGQFVVESLAANHAGVDFARVDIDFVSEAASIEDRGRAIRGAFYRAFPDTETMTFWTRAIYDLDGYLIASYNGTLYRVNITTNEQNELIFSPITDWVRVYHNQSYSTDPPITPIPIGTTDDDDSGITITGETMAGLTPQQIEKMQADNQRLIAQVAAMEADQAKARIRTAVETLFADTKFTDDDTRNLVIESAVTRAQNMTDPSNDQLRLIHTDLTVNKGYIMTAEADTSPTGSAAVETGITYRAPVITNPASGAAQYTTQTNDQLIAEAAKIDLTKLTY